jgi:Fe-S-cluster containining protein
VTARRRRGRPAPPARRATAAELAARLDAVYAQLPEIECRGKCWDSCGPIAMTAPEQARVAAAGVDIPTSNYFTDGPALCPALTMLRRCAVYEVRPLICRLWGLTEWMPCTYGCRPEGGLIKDAVARELLAQVAEIGGDVEQARRWREIPGEDYMRTLRQVLAADAEDRLRRTARARSTGGGPVYVLGPGRLGTSPPT